MITYYAGMRKVIELHGERWRIGDGVLAVFGALVSRKNDPLHAVRCAAAMLDELTTMSEDLYLTWGVRLVKRAGVHTGEVVVAAGAELVGDAMNTAARLDQAAAPNEVLIGEATWRLVRHEVRLEPVRATTLKGKRARCVLATPRSEAHPGYGRRRGRTVTVRDRYCPAKRTFPVNEAGMMSLRCASRRFGRGPPGQVGRTEFVTSSDYGSW